MKLILFVVALVGASAQAATLKCWNTYSSDRTPTVTAQIVANNQLTDIQVRHDDVDVTEGLVEGNLITTGRSPYKGNNRFVLRNAEIVLPVSLASVDLKAAQGNRDLGFFQRENAVLIGNFREGDGSGSHFSVRLRCRSYQ